MAPRDYSGDGAEITPRPRTLTSLVVQQHPRPFFPAEDFREDYALSRPIFGIAQLINYDYRYRV